jgi:hypothetical protein
MDKTDPVTVEVERSRSLAGYPLAQFCEWAQASGQYPSLEPSEGGNDDRKDKRTTGARS